MFRPLTFLRAKQVMLADSSKSWAGSEAFLSLESVSDSSGGHWVTATARDSQKLGMSKSKVIHFTKIRKAERCLKENDLLSARR